MSVSPPPYRTSSFSHGAHANVPSAWPTILPGLVHRVKQSRKRRLDETHGPLIEERKRALEEAYEAKRKNISPRQWRSIEFLSLPPPQSLLDIPSILDFVYSEPEQSLGVAEFRTFLDSEKSLSDWLAEATARYNVLVNDGTRAVISAHPSFLADIGDRPLFDCALLTYVDWDNGKISPALYADDCTDLPTILCRRLFGAGIGLPVRSLEYFPRRSQAVSSILELLHLPVTTTVAELDARNARFDCMVCRPGRIRGGGWQKHVYTWRSAVRSVLLLSKSRAYRLACAMWLARVNVRGSWAHRSYITAGTTRGPGRRKASRRNLSFCPKRRPPKHARRRVPASM